MHVFFRNNETSGSLLHRTVAGRMVPEWDGDTKKPGMPGFPHTLIPRPPTLHIQSMANFPCRQCGAAINAPAWRFCPYCGGLLTGPFGQGRTTAPPPSPRRRTAFSLRFAGLLLLLIATAVFVPAFLPGTAPVPTTANASAAECPDDAIPPSPVQEHTTSLPLGDSPAVPVISAPWLEARVHDRINQVREEHGLSVLGTDSALVSLARAHSTDMASHGYFGHVNLHEMDATARGAAAGFACHKTADPYYTSAIAENLYATYRYSTVLVAEDGEPLFSWTTGEAMANETVDAWMNSPEHRANVLDPGMGREGIGVAFGPGDMVFITEDFC